MTFKWYKKLHITNGKSVHEASVKNCGKIAGKNNYNLISYFSFLDISVFANIFHESQILVQTYEHAWYISPCFAPGQYTRNRRSRRSRSSRGRRGSIETVVSDVGKTLARKFIGYSEMNSAGRSSLHIHGFCPWRVFALSGHPMKNSCKRNRQLILQRKETYIFLFYKLYFNLFYYTEHVLHAYIVYIVIKYA